MNYLGLSHSHFLSRQDVFNLISTFFKKREKKTYLNLLFGFGKDFDFAPCFLYSFPFYSWYMWMCYKWFFLEVICFKFKNGILNNRWLDNDYTHIYYKVEKKLFLDIKNRGNKVISINFFDSHGFIPIWECENIHSYRILYSFFFF